MEMIPVSSSDIRAIGYDAATATLRVDFISGGIYEYFDVPESVHANFLRAASYGEFLNDFIRYNYRYQRIG